jgi:hypothetical protein
MGMWDTWDKAEVAGSFQNEIDAGIQILINTIT